MTNEITNSTHKAEIVPIVLLPHPNADTLSIVKVYGYQVCARTEDWLGKETAAYLPPDTICPDTPHFEFLGTNKRIKAKKLRGVVSFGLLMPCPEGMNVGDDAWDYYGLTHYNPPEPATTGGEAGPAPKGANYSKYDVDSLRRYKDLFIPGEEVVATIKYHGANARFVFDGEEMYCGSRTEWKRKVEGNLWWRCLEQYPQIEEFCRDFPHTAIYGEVFGFNKGFDYGVAKGKLGFRAFDILMTYTAERQAWDDHDEARAWAKEIPFVTEVYRGPFDYELLSSIAEGNMPEGEGKHIMEGIVVKPLKERWTYECGRLQLKLVSSRYLEKN